MNRQEIIKKLQGDKQYCFGMLEPEEQKLIIELNEKGVIQDYKKSRWSVANLKRILVDSVAYRIDPSYKEESELSLNEKKSLQSEDEPEVSFLDMLNTAKYESWQEGVLWGLGIAKNMHTLLMLNIPLKEQQQVRDRYTFLIKKDLKMLNIQIDFFQKHK